MQYSDKYLQSGGVSSSRISGFHKLSIDERIDKVAELTGLSEDDVEMLRCSFTDYNIERIAKLTGLSEEQVERLKKSPLNYFPSTVADSYIENCIAGCDPPMGIVTNARINGIDYLIPMRAEEPSIVAAASRGFLEARRFGIEAKSIGNSLKGQIYIKSLANISVARGQLNANMEKLLAKANDSHSHTRAHNYEIRPAEDGLLLYLIVETGDVQGANVVNQMCEAIKPDVERLTGGSVVTGILSNYADYCLAKATMRVPIERLARPELGCPDAEKVCELFLDLARLAVNDVDRATTNNKGIMNGVSSVALATGNDLRALEAGAHAYAARSGKYRSMSEWKRDGDYLEGYLCMPLALGTVRGATGLPFASIGLKILGNPSAQELQAIEVSTGIANNYSAINTLVTDGINRGHLELHNKRF